MITRLMWPFIILQIATVVAIVLFLRSLLHNQLEIGLKRIQKLDQENLEKNTELNKGLAELEKERETTLADTEHKVKVMLEKAQEEIRKMREEERVRLKTEAKKIIAGALQQKDKMLKDSDYEVFNKGVDLSKHILERIFSDSELKDFNAKISKDVIDFITNSEQAEKFFKGKEDLEVVSVEAIGSEEKKCITKAVKDKSASDTKVTFTVDKNILGGIVLRADKQVLDASIACRISKAVNALREGKA